MLRKATVFVSTTFAVLAAGSAAAAVFVAVEEKGTTQTGKYGEAPNEIVWTEDGSRMVLIPGGTYKVGTSNAGLPEYSSSEGPETTVTVDWFYIDKYEIEYEQYMKIAETASLPKPTDSANRPGAAKPGMPVTGISWDAAADYAKAVQRALPTEAEWEVAARGAAANLYPSGDTPRAGLVLARGATALPEKVGTVSMDVSAFGVHDMAGNVSEWVADAYARDYYAKIAGQAAPLLNEGGSDARTLRGGNYYTQTDGRLTRRFPGVPNQSREEVGFRTVFRLQPKPVEPTPTPTPIPPTPTPSANVRVDAMRKVLEPLLASNTFVVPTELSAFGDLAGSVPVLNRSPFDARLAGVSLDEGTIYFLNSQVPSGESARVAFPKDSLVNLFAWAKTPAGDRLVSLGPVNEAGAPLVLVETDTFSPVTKEGDDESASDRPTPNEIVAKQIYAGGYYPQWNEVLVHNSSPLPIEIAFGQPMKDGSAKEAMRQVLLAGETFLATSLKPGNWRATARYVGATEEIQSNLLGFAIDDKADLRILRLTQATGGEVVRVMTGYQAKIEIAGKDVKLPEELRKTYLPGGTEPDSGTARKPAARRPR